MKYSKDYGLKIAIILAIIGVVAIFIPYFIFDNLGIGKFKIRIGDYDKLGAFISGVSAPFLSLSAFILLYLTYTSQKEELAESRELLRQQNKALVAQQQETTFFNTLSLFNNVINELKYTRTFNYGRILDGPTSTEYYGREIFGQLYIKVQGGFSEFNVDALDETVEPNGQLEFNTIKNAISAYSKMYESNSYILGHYFRILYNILKFVDESDLLNKKHYTNIVRSQISTYEHILIFYNGLSENGVEKLKPLIEKYSFLNNMPINHLLHNSHTSSYTERAYN